MRIINATLESIYVWDQDDEKKEREKEKKVEKRKMILSKVGIKVDDEDLSKSVSILATESQLADLIVFGESVTASSSFDLTEDRFMRAADAIEMAAAKIEKFAGSIPDVNNHYNERVEVYTPGSGLMLFNRIMLLQDACSDALQTELDNGWRIVAACPQPDQRRPDYILGRYDPQHALESGANTSAVRP